MQKIRDPNRFGIAWSTVQQVQTRWESTGPIRGQYENQNSINIKNDPNDSSIEEESM